MEKTVQPSFPPVIFIFFNTKFCLFYSATFSLFNMLHIFVLMMCNCTVAFAKMQQYGTVGISTLGNISQKCPKSLNSADFHKSLPQGNFCLFREIQWNQQTPFLWTQFYHCRSARVGLAETSASNGVKAQTPDWVTSVQRVAAHQVKRALSWWFFWLWCQPRGRAAPLAQRREAALRFGSSEPLNWLIH